MDKQYNVSNIDFSGEWMILSVNEEIFEIPIVQASKKLAQAIDIERRMYRISPSGYGIHWYAIDEDITTNGLIKLATVAQTA